MTVTSRTATGSVGSDGAWREIGERLREPGTLLSKAERESFLEEWHAIDTAEQSLDDRLLLGLVGGTGVGKSTLINALASQRISQAGDRRPTTDRIVVYRHASTDLPEAFATNDMADPQVVHENEALERVVLFDFPDFDSLQKVHHEIFRRYVPRLDVLVVLVDDVKYADARLFDLLRALPQSHENLHPVLNKIDLLARRYPTNWTSVVEEILADLASKLAQHADVRVDPRRMLAISAQRAFEARVDRSEAEAPSAEHECGDFPRILEFLSGYRAEKRRRAAKELNLDARRIALAERLRHGPLAPGRAEGVREALALARERGRAVEHSLAAIPERIFRRAERESVVRAALARAAPHIGFPIDVLWGFPSLLPWWRGRSADDEPLDLSAARIRRHYRALFDGVANLRRELRLRAGDVELLTGEAAEASSQAVLLPWNEIRDGFQSNLGRCEERVRSRSRWWNHLAPLAVLVLALWSVGYPVIESAIIAWGSEEGVSFWSVLRESFVAGIRLLDPFHVVGVLVLYVLAYAATAMVVRLRQRQRLERAIDAAEKDVRERARSYVVGSLGSFEESLEGWLDERERLLRAVRPFVES